LSGINYYRLREVDFDGTFEYSQIISATWVPSDLEFKLSLYPNPAQEYLNVSSNLNMGEVYYQIYDVRGALTQSGRQVAGDQKLELDISDLQRGMYHLRLNFGEEIKILRFIKQN